MKRNKQWLALSTSLLLIVSFQNCSKVQVASEAANAPLGDGGSNPNPPGGGGGGTDNPTPAGDYEATFKFKPSAKKADIILVIDNSKSMQPDSQHLASRLSGFVSYLSSLQIDWQMCITTTDIEKSSDRAIKWTGANSYTVNASTPNLSAVFADSVNARFNPGGTGDERGIASLNKHIDSQGTHGCYRAGAVTSTIVLSDENERTDGTNLQDIDKPSVYIEKLSQLQISLGYHANLLSNSIIIKSGDTSCFNSQNADFPAYYGKSYELLSSLTQGNVGSICAPDYTDQLNDISARIDSATLSLLLKCVPVSSSVQVVSVVPSSAAYTWQVKDNRIFITSSSSTEFDVKFKYTCQ